MDEFFIQIITISILSLTSAKAGVLHGSTLPGNILPEHYKVHLTPDENVYYEYFKYGYKGSVEIDLKVIKDNVTTIVLHTDEQKHLKYQEILLQYSNGTKENLQVGEYSEKNETQQFKSKNVLPKKELLKLMIKFTNELGGGLFTSLISNDHRSNPKGFFLVSHGQPDKIRKMFPCLDEPVYKATFEILFTLPDWIVGKGYHVLTNTELYKTLKSGNSTTFVFEKTPIPMSTYLVAILVARYNKTLVDKFNSSYPNIATNDNLKAIKTWGGPKMLQRENIKKLHDISRGLLEAFTKKFQIGYAFKKLDQVFVEYFPYFGMENYGLIFYQKSKFERGDILEHSYILAHELAHQWFGNLVTVRDWVNDFWIQEGFAHYFAIITQDEVKVNGLPAGYYDFTNGLVVNRILPALRMDFDGKVPPLIDAITTLFGAAHVMFTYDKAAAIIRMLKLSYGNEIFDKGIQYYFRIYKEKNANTTELLKCFDLALETTRPNSTIRKPSEIGFENWIKYPGYPLLTVSKARDASNRYLLTQAKFFHDKAPRPLERSRWPIPITYSTNANLNFNKTEAVFWMNPNDTGLTIITLPKFARWIIFNHQMAGYYRVDYDYTNWGGLIVALNNETTFQQIHELNRAQLLDDSITLATAKRKHRYFTDHELGMLYRYLKHENKYYPWKAAIDSVTSVCSTPVANFFNCAKFKIGFHSTVKKIYEELKNKQPSNRSYQDIKLWELIKNYYCKNLDPACQGKPNKA